MAFKLRCPKCDGFDYSIERDNRTFGAVAQAFELVYHCRCGKQMFGEQLVKEYERQKAAWETSGAVEDVVEAALAPSPLEEAVQESPRLRPVEPPEGPVEQARRQSEEDRRWREKVQVSAQEVTAVPVTRPAPVSADQVCAWPTCEKQRRPNSKYCSRACSNKNARARHKARQKKGKGKSAKSAAP